MSSERTVLVTGGTGFIGRHVLPRLVAAGYDVHAVSSRVAPADARAMTCGVTWHRADLLEAGEPTRVAESVCADRLLHLAWYVEHGKYWTSPINVHWVQASLELVRAFHSAGGRRVVSAGTCAEYDWNGDGWCDDATTALHPATLYGVCKRALGAVLDAYGRECGLDVAWGRIFFVYGAHEPRERAVPSVARALLAGDLADCTRGDQQRDFLHVEDAAAAFVALLDSSVTGAVNIASGEAVALADVFRTIARLLGREDALRLGTIADRPRDPPVLAAVTRRLAEEVRWRPAIDLTAGLQDTIEWWRAHA